VPRMYQAEGALAVGTKVSDQNVGGARAAVNPRLTAHMSVTKDTTIDVDGMKMNTLVGGGDSHPDHNDAMSQEITVQVAALGADASVGGPIKRDRLWFFGSYRNVGNDNIVANSFYPDGSPGIYDQRVRNYTLRLTWQVNPRNKITAYDDYQWKYVGHLFTSGTEVLLAAARRPPVLKYTDAIKWTSTVTNRLVYDVGFGTSVNAYREGYQPGILRTPFTPEWYANASRVDIVRNTTNLAAPPELGTYNFRYMLVSTLAYVTGSHAVKAGLQWHIGQNWINRDANGDLTVRFRDGQPDSVIVYDTPTRLYDLMKADLGVYVQDSWTLKRLTINPGLRWEYFNSAIQAKAVE